MIEGSTITVLDKPEQPGGNNLCAAEIISFELDIAGKMVPFHINVAAEKATLADIVPLARKLSTKLAIASLAGLRENGQSVPCCKGCRACCSYLIPLSIPEVFRLREEFLAMPTEYSTPLLHSCLNTAEIILDKKFRTSYLKNFSKNGQPRISQVNKWYGGLKLACPFLSDGLCTLYVQRPVACREHIVIGSDVSCQPGLRGKPNVVPMPVSILEALGQLTAELEQSDIEAVMLPLAFAWAQENLQRAERTWPAAAMVKRFVEILHEMSAKNSVVSALPNLICG